MLAQRYAALLLLLLSASLVASCDDPCLALSDEMCRCERTESEQLSCAQRVEAVTVATPTDEEQECCSRLLDTCTCEALDNGNLAACGIAQEDEATGQNQCLVSESRDPG